MIKKIFFLVFLLCVAEWFTRTTIEGFRNGDHRLKRSNYRIMSETGLNVRSGPGQQYAILATLPNYSKIKRDSIVGEWSHITHIPGKKGFVKTTYLKADIKANDYQLYTFWFYFICAIISSLLLCWYPFKYFFIFFKKIAVSLYETGQRQIMYLRKREEKNSLRCVLHENNVVDEKHSLHSNYHNFPNDHTNNKKNVEFKVSTSEIRSPKHYCDNDGRGKKQMVILSTTKIHEKPKLALRNTSLEKKHYADKVITTPTDVLRKIAKDEDWEVREKVAGNPNTPQMMPVKANLNTIGQNMPKCVFCDKDVINEKYLFCCDCFNGKDSSTAVQKFIEEYNATIKKYNATIKKYKKNTNPPTPSTICLFVKLKEEWEMRKEINGLNDLKIELEHPNAYTTTNNAGGCKHVDIALVNNNNTKSMHIEVDGGYHNLSRVCCTDIQRTTYDFNDGILTLRVSNEAVRNFLTESFKKTGSKESNIANIILNSYISVPSRLGRVKKLQSPKLASKNQKCRSSKAD